MSDTGDPIEHFKARREREVFEKRFAVRAAEAQKELRRLLEESERKEILAKQVGREMEEFFRDSTRLAAQVFGSICKKEAKAIEKKVALEMRQFFQELSQEAGNLIQALTAKELSHTETVQAFEDLFQQSIKPIATAASSMVRGNGP